MIETTMYSKLKLIFKKTNSLFQRIESGTTGLGIPDAFFRTKESEGWIELKEITWPYKEHTIIKIPFRPGQYPWLIKYSQLNGNSFLICSIRGREQNIYMFKRAFIYQEYTQKEFLHYAYYIGKIRNLSVIDFN